jgi:uncharacterized protein YqfA (UPF0365 family)
MNTMPDPRLLLPLIVAVLALLVFLAMFCIALAYFRLWMQGIMAGVHVSLFDLIGMKLRKIDARLVMKCLILARQSGVDVSVADLQRAYLQGVNQERLTLAHIEAQKQQLGVTFQELIDLDLKDRLAEKLKR